jgi:arylsulfatase A-like enzyme
MFDEALAHNDHQIGKLIERLKAIGEWENTLFVVTADHSAWAAMDDIGIAVLDSLPPSWSAPMFRPSVSRVPLIMVWPGHIPPGSRIDEAVSLIDALPTVVELAGLPRPEVLQGQSLVPLLMGRPGWERRPVILDQFQVDHRGELRGVIEAVDGRWGASLWIGAKPTHFETLLPTEEGTFEEERPSPLLLYDLWDDPMALRPVNERHPERVDYYTRFLEGQWAAHRALAERFTPGDQTELTPEQLESLRGLGYIQ